MKKDKNKNGKKTNVISKIKAFIKRIPKVVKIIILVLIAVIIFGFIIKNSFSNTHKEVVLNFGFKDVGELVTQEWYGRIIEDSTSNRKLFDKIKIPFTDSRIIFSLDVEVLAGINFSEIEYKLKNDNTIKITLPKAEIYKNYQIPNTFIEYLDEESWFTNISSKERHELEDAVVEKGKKQAIEAGILERADKNAKVIIEQVVKSHNKDLKIEWEYK